MKFWLQNSESEWILVFNVISIKNELQPKNMTLSYDFINHHKRWKPYKNESMRIIIFIAFAISDPFVKQKPVYSFIIFDTK